MQEQNKKPIALDAYEKLAERFAKISDSKLENAYLDRPAVLSMLPSVRGRVALDAGCGSGAYSEWLRDHGAEVIAVDASPAMARITQERLGPGSRVYQADLARPLAFLSAGAVDIILSSLTLSYLEDLDGVYKEFHRVLRDRGCLVVSIGHPWAEFKYTKNENYFETEILSMEWRGFGEPYVEVPWYRKSLTAVLRPLCRQGFLIDDIFEPRPVREGKDVDPEVYERLSRYPGFFCFRAIKARGVQS